MSLRLAHAAAWSLAGKLVSAATGIVAVVLITRWVGPQAYGIFALAWVAIALAEVVVGGALAESLVQARQVDDGHVDATFWVSIALAVGAAAAVALAAVPIAALMGGGATLAEILPWRAATLPLTAAAMVPAHLLIRSMRFKAVVGCETGAALIGNLSGIAMAVAGFGLWALVWMELIRVAVLLVAVSTAARWLPGLRGRWHHLRELNALSATTVAMRSLTWLERVAPRWAIGRLLGVEALGFFALGQRLVDQLHAVTVAPGYNIAMAAANRLRDDRPGLQSLLLRALEAGASISYPVHLGLIALMPWLVPVVLGPQWVAATLPMQVFLLLGLRAPSTAFNSAVLRSTGHAGRTLVVTAVTTAAVLLLVPAAVLFAVGTTSGAAAVIVVAAVVAARGMAWPVSMLHVRHAIGLSVRRQATAGVAQLVSSIAMAAGLVAGATWFDDQLSPVVMLPLLLAAGAALYAIVLVWLSQPARRIAVALLRGLCERESGTARRLMRTAFESSR